jgi:hypothetical protein
MSPYIVTTKRPHWSGREPNPDPYGVSRRAVATLEEDRVADALRPLRQTMGGLAWLNLLNNVRGLKRGGTVGPLPDGTVIEVVPMDEEEMRVYASISEVEDAYERPMPELLDAYNARQA